MDGQTLYDKWQTFLEVSSEAGSQYVNSLKPNEFDALTNFMILKTLDLTMQGLEKLVRRLEVEIG